MHDIFPIQSGPPQRSQTPVLADLAIFFPKSHMTGQPWTGQCPRSFARRRDPPRCMAPLPGGMAWPPEETAATPQGPSRRCGRHPPRRTAAIPKGPPKKWPHPPRTPRGHGVAPVLADLAIFFPKGHMTGQPWTGQRPRPPARRGTHAGGNGMTPPPRRRGRHAPNPGASPARHANPHSDGLGNSFLSKVTCRHWPPDRLPSGGTASPPLGLTVPPPGGAMTPPGAPGTPVRAQPAYVVQVPLPYFFIFIVL